MKIKFVEEARLEFLDTISYYENHQLGLGGRFKSEVGKDAALVS
jgi:hypothetical protein